METETRTQTINSLSAELQLEAEMNVKNAIANKKNWLVQKIILFVTLVSFIIAVFFNGQLNDITFTFVSVIFFGLVILMLFFTPVKIFKPSAIKDTPKLRMNVAAEYVAIITERIKSIPGEMAEREKNILNIEENLATYQRESAEELDEEKKGIEILEKNLSLLENIIRSL